MFAKIIAEKLILYSNIVGLLFLASNLGCVRKALNLIDHLLLASIRLQGYPPTSGFSISQKTYEVRLVRFGLTARFFPLDHFREFQYCHVVREFYYSMLSPDRGNDLIQHKESFGS